MFCTFSASIADIGIAVGAVLAAFFTNYFTVFAGVAISADRAAIGTHLSAIRAEPHMLLALAAVSADLSTAVDTAFIAFRADLGTVTAQFTCSTAIVSAFKALKASYAIRPFSTVIQTVAAFRAVTLVVLRTFYTELAFFTIVVA